MQCEHFHVVLFFLDGVVLTFSCFIKPCNMTLLRQILFVCRQFVLTAGINKSPTLIRIKT